MRTEKKIKLDTNDSISHKCDERKQITTFLITRSRSREKENDVRPFEKDVADPYGAALYGIWMHTRIGSDERRKRDR